MSDQPSEEATKVSLPINPILGTFLKELPLPLGIAPNASCFQLVPFEEDDGTKSVAIALGFSVGNNLNIYWFRENELREFIGNAMRSHQIQMAEIEKLHPLQVADTATMNQIVQQKNMVDGKLVLGKHIEGFK